MPKKEQDIFKSIIQAYETKQYQKGIKQAEIILKKYPNHGETLSMKGLILNSMGKKEEAYELAKLGLKNDVRSHICWHALGLLHRSDNNYKEAIKCYLNALRIDHNNQNILRDLSWLQIQIRDIFGFTNTRRTILSAKPTMRLSWVAYAVGAYLSGTYAVAFDVINRYYNTISNSERGEKYEESELLLFQNKCLEKQGKYAEAIAHLESNTKTIVDKNSLKIKQAEYLLLLGRFEEAKEKWLSLVLAQSDTYYMHVGLQCAALSLPLETSLAMLKLRRLELPSTVLVLTPEERSLLVALYTSLDSKLKHSSVVLRIKLTFLEGDEFSTLLQQHIRRGLSSGIPSLNQDICHLIRNVDPCVSPRLTDGAGSGETDSAPRRIYERAIVTDDREFRVHPLTEYILQLVRSYIDSLEATSTFPPLANASASAVEPSAASIEPPTALLWARYLYCHLLEKSGLLPQALEQAEKCIEHTPTATDMYLKKGKILKKLMDYSGASAVVNSGRELDLQDRYLNNKCTKYYFRSNQIPEAMRSISLFTKHDVEQNVEQTLFNLQVTWYELEAAEAYSRLKRWGFALKKFHDVLKHFQDYTEDMFDFHNYANRKVSEILCTPFL